MGARADNYRRLRESIPEEVSLLVAVKGHSPAEIAEVIEAGARFIGENYVQEAEAAVAALGETARRAEWHMIGHLQRNKVNKALGLFDVIQTLDSAKLARAIDARCARPTRVMIEVNAGCEESKSGVAPEEAEALLRAACDCANLRVVGMMAMEPYYEDPEQARPCFRRMKELFDSLRALALPNANLETLSMGMSNSYRVAIEEGANMVRLGTAIMGPRTS
jgi:pyridoxal phosphate enzyme (YggS family)